MELRHRWLRPTGRPAGSHMAHVLVATVLLLLCYISTECGSLVSAAPAGINRTRSQYRATGVPKNMFVTRLVRGNATAANASAQQKPVTAFDGAATGLHRAAAAATPSPATTMFLESARVGPAPTPSPPAAPVSRCVAGTLNTTTGNCTCQPGWTGIGCLTCTGTAPVCAGVMGDPTSTCSTQLMYDTSAKYKAYSCDMTGPLASLVSAITVFCSFTGGLEPAWLEPGTLGIPAAWMQPQAPQPASSNTSGWCQLQVNVATSPDNPLICGLSRCSFPLGGTTFSCATGNCTCPAPGGCGRIVNSILAAKQSAGDPYVFDCSTAGTCKLKGIGNWELPAQCAAGGCSYADKQQQAAAAAATKPGLGPSQALTAAAVKSVNSSAPSSQAAAGAPPLAAVLCSLPLLVLLAAAALGGIYCVVHRGYLMPFKKYFLQEGQGAQQQRGLRYQRQHLPAQVHSAPFVASTDSGGVDGQVMMPNAAVAVKGAAPQAAAAAAVASHADPHYTSSTAAASDVSSGYWDEPVLPASQLQLVFENVTCTVPSAGSKEPACPPAADNVEESSAALVEGPHSIISSSQAQPATPASDTSGRQVILSSISGAAAAGQVLGVMGPSGSGKSTLLSILSGNRDLLGAGSSVTGRVTLGGEARKGALRKVTAFVPQKDVLLPALTVEECVRYSALLRLPKDFSAADVQDRIRAVVHELHLEGVVNSLVGGTPAIRGVSGGERRRVTIGMELVTQPRLLVMDEPTSGLDSYTAHQLMLSVKELAAAGRVVVMSLHQPSPDTFLQLDQILVLARGNAVYQGPPAAVEQFLAAAGVDSNARWSPAEQLLHAASVPHALEKLQLQQQKRQQARQLLPPPTPESAGPNSTTTSEVAVTASRSNRGVSSIKSSALRTVHALSILLWRSFTDILRSPSMLLLHNSVALLMGLLVGLVFFKLDDSNVGVQNRLGAMFFALALFGFSGTTAIDSLVLERELLQREVSAGYYSSGIYLVSKMVLDGLLLRTLPAILFSVLMYPLVGLAANAVKAITFGLVLATYAATVGVLTVAITALCGNGAAATLSMNLILLLWVLVGGYLVNPSSIPPWLRWVRALSPMSYALEAMASNEIAGQLYDLKVEGFPTVAGIDGEVFLSTLGLVPGRVVQDVAVLLGFYGGSVLLAVVAVKLSLLLPHGWSHAWHQLMHMRHQRKAA